MFDFRKLLKILEREFTYQEKLLAVLVRERAAIVKLNQEDLDRLRTEKETILNEMMELEQRRKQIFVDLEPELLAKKQAENKDTPSTFVDVLELCPPAEGRGQLKHVGANLKKLAINVQEMNDENGLLIRQSLGLIASTIAIMTQAPESDLPTYNRKGSFPAGPEDPAFGISRKPFLHEV